MTSPVLDDDPSDWPNSSEGRLLSVRDLVVTYQTRTAPVAAVKGIDIDLNDGEVVAIIGGSGSGKSAALRAILRLIPSNIGSVRSTRHEFMGRDVGGMSDESVRRLRATEIGTIMQDPSAALNPCMAIGEHLGEVLRVHGGHSRRESLAKAASLLERVGIPDVGRRMLAYPHQLSGGMAQRVCIAMGIALEPRLLIADEPTSALDATVQAQILELLNELRAETGMAILMVTHDLGVAARLANSAVVMSEGLVVEAGSVRDLYEKPSHEVTRALVDARKGW